MDDMTELALEGASTGIDHYEKVYDPLKAQVKRLPNPLRKSRTQQYDSDDDQDYYDPPRRSNTERVSRRSQGPRAGEYVEETYERKSGRAKSTGRDGQFRDGRGLDRDGRPRNYRKTYSDSESSLSPPPRRRKSLGEQALAALGVGGALAAEHERHKSDDRDQARRRHHRESDRDYDRDRRQDRFSRDDRLRDDRLRDDRLRDDRPRRAETFSDRSSQRRIPAGYIPSNGSERDLPVATRNGGTSQSVAPRNTPRDNANGNTRRPSSTSSSSSSSVCSSSEDERRIKKMKGKEFITAGLAAVATIHAAAGVYSSMEAQFKRHEELIKGEISPEEARRKKNKARLQDLAAVGIAALGIKGAVSEWKEVQEGRHELSEQRESREKRHEKRLKRAEKEARRAREARGGGRGNDRDGRYRRDGRGGNERDGYRSA